MKKLPGEIKSVLDLLRKKITGNISMYYKNREEIDRLLKENDTDERNRLLNKLMLNNNLILKENEMIIDLQEGLINYSEEFDNEELGFLKNEEDEENSIFIKIIKGEEIFNEKHPNHGDMELIDQLVEHYIHGENYEECARLVNIKKSLTKIKEKTEV
ncbi:MAG: hypothetical protein ACOCWG_05215 [bacterium]